MYDVYTNDSLHGVCFPTVTILHFYDCKMTILDENSSMMGPLMVIETTPASKHLPTKVPETEISLIK